MTVKSAHNFRTLHSDAHLALMFRQGEGDTLAISFDSIDPKNLNPDFISDRQVERMANGGNNHIVVVRDPSWARFTKDGSWDLLVAHLSAIIDLVKPQKILVYGYSLGACMAIDICRFIRVDAVFAIAPQIDLGPFYAGFDTRRNVWSRTYRVADTGIAHLQDAVSACPDLFMLHGLRGRDAAHAAISPIGENITHYLIPDMGHEIAPRLTRGGHFHAMVSAFFRGDADALDTEARRAGAIRKGEYTHSRPGHFDWEPVPLTADLFWYQIARSFHAANRPIYKKIADAFRILNRALRASIKKGLKT